jgi:hypothetical protein
VKEITVVKTPTGLRGWTDEDQKHYANMKRRIEELTPGEFARVGFAGARIGPFHRKFFAMLNLAFDAWDPASQRRKRKYKGVTIAKNFEQFREDVTIQAGYYEPRYHADGSMSLKAKSISYDNMGQDEFEQLYSAVADVLLSMPFMSRYNRAELDRVVGELMRFAH